MRTVVIAVWCVAAAVPGLAAQGRDAHHRQTGRQSEDGRHAQRRYRTIDPGDLTWNGELDLMCPTNRIGTVDLYLTSHHGPEKSESPALPILVP